MNGKINISDELIAKYLSGMASPDEEAAVLDYLSENDEHLEDLLNMSTAIELQHKDNDNSKTAIQRPKHRYLWYVPAAAAAIALFILIGTFLFHPKQLPDNQLVQEETITNSTQTPAPVSIDSTDTEESTTPASTQRNPIPKIQEPKHYADSARKRNYATMLYPSTKVTSVSEQRQSVTFRWNTDAVDIHLQVKSSDNQTLVDQKLGAAKYYGLSLPKETDTLKWQATFTYSDGTSSTKEGTIIRWDTGINSNSNEK